MCFYQENVGLKREGKNIKRISCFRIKTLREIMSWQNKNKNHQEEENIEKQI